MIRLLFLIVFRLSGWKIEGRLPPAPHRFVAIVAPHTSAWDVLWGMCAKEILRIKMVFIGKKSLFSTPMGPILRYFGGRPVDRENNNNMVEQVCQMFKENERFIFGLSPEGTRAKVNKFRTGFYQIALCADVPILLCYLDFKRKIGGFGPLFYPSGDQEKDLHEIWNFYAGIPGYYPEKSIYGEYNSTQ